MTVSLPRLSWTPSTVNTQGQHLPRLAVVTNNFTQAFPACLQVYHALHPKSGGSSHAELGEVAAKVARAKVTQSCGVVPDTFCMICRLLKVRQHCLCWRYAQEHQILPANSQLHCQNLSHAAMQCVNVSGLTKFQAGTVALSTLCIALVLMQQLVAGWQKLPKCKRSSCCEWQLSASPAGTLGYCCGWESHICLWQHTIYGCHEGGGELFDHIDHCAWVSYKIGLSVSMQNPAYDRRPYIHR